MRPHVYDADGATETRDYSIMPFRFPGSSEQAATTLAPIVEPPPEVRDKLAALSLDEPLPEVYAGDSIRLLAQSPYRLYVYWNHSRDPRETLRRAFGASGAARYALALRLVEVESGEASFYEASPTRNYWFNVRPGRRYRVDVGFYAQGRPFVRLLTSEAVRTPRVTVSRVSDDAPEFHVSPPEFARLLNEAGYATDALEVTLEAADEATHDETTRQLARALTGADAPAANTDDGLSEMRALLAALALGEPLERILPVLSPALAAWLKQLAEERREALDTARLLDLLRASLALELEYDQRLDAATAEAARRAARFVWGASDVQMPTRAPRIWMPSMSVGLASRVARWKKIEVGG